ncbi:MAG: addiction module protein [Planctomycetales bacterium]
MPNFQDVLDAARTLSATEQLRLVETLWEEGVPADVLAPSDEWIAEVQRRSAAFDQGTMPSATWDDVRSRARSKAGLDG